MNTKNKNIVKTAGLLLAGILLGWLIFGGGNTADEVSHDHTEVDGEQIWTCSMHPQIRQNEPGDCPICGMDLIPLESEDAGGDPESYQMSENAMKLANVQTIIVGRGDASREIRLNGKVQVDERNAYSQSTHIPGRIEQLSINFTGERVNRGQILATVYSPELVTAQEELLQAYEIKERQPELFEAAREKLRNWKIGKGQIDKIIAGGRPIERFPIQADVNGIVTEKMVDLGDYVERGMPIYEISDLSKVWVLFDLYEGEMGWITEGSKIKYTVRSIPGEIFEGTIDFIDPLINSQTRVARARVEVDNKEGRLKPEMFASGVVKNNNRKADAEDIIIPKSAVLWTGKRSVVYVKNDFGFKIREIGLGSSLGDAYIVEKGLEEGEEIVSNGTFTVDAAVQLSGRPSMMNPSGEAVNSGHDHGNMEKAPSTPPALEISESVKSELNMVLVSYLELKDALVEDDLSSAKQQASALAGIIEGIDAAAMNTEANSEWEKFKQQLGRRALSLSSAETISEMREDFEELSGEMIQFVKVFPVNKNLYVQHCPMANNDRGADWLSLSEEIRNPYYGDAMLTCGEIKEQLN